MVFFLPTQYGRTRFSGEDRNEQVRAVKCPALRNDFPIINRHELGRPGLWVKAIFNKKNFIPGRFLPAVASLFVFLIFLTVPDSAWALQSHGPPEGIYVHQMAHILFFGSLLYMYWDLRRSSFAGRGWTYLQWFCLLMLIWNVIAFTGHAVTIRLEPGYISTATSYIHARLMGPMNLHKVVFYLTRFDHVVVVPALFFLCIGLRSLYRSVEIQESGVEDK